jgi:hypothetical protein
MALKKFLHLKFNGGGRKINLKRVPHHLWCSGVGKRRELIAGAMAMAAEKKLSGPNIAVPPL